MVDHGVGARRRPLRGVGMNGPVTRVSSGWLALREPADAAARALELVTHLDRRPPPGGRWVIHDLGSGTGSMGRWLAPLLSGPQHWIAHDRDADLLALVSARPPGRAADGAAVTVEARQSDITWLEPGDIADATLITASALLDMLTEDELARLIEVCSGQGCPILLTLSVAGHVEITPPDPLDARVEAAFNDHQRRATARGHLLGPDAVAIAAEQFGRLCAEILVRPSPWLLGPDHAALTAEWFKGWVDAAREQQPDLAPDIGAYSRRRLTQLSAGVLTATVAHEDLLVLSPG
jgi:predicted RNA methylase